MEAGLFMPCVTHFRGTRASEITRNPLVGMMWPSPGRAGFCPWLCRVKDAVKKLRNSKPLGCAALEAFQMKVTLFRHSSRPSERPSEGKLLGSSQKPFEVLSGRRGPSSAGLEDESDKDKEVKDENRVRGEK